MKEIWKAVAGFEGIYSVSNQSRVKSLSRPVPSMGTFRITTEKILKPGRSSNGYYTVNLLGRSHLIHRLVAEHFIANPDNLAQINHINGVRTDNRIENLEWVSPRENVTHSKKRLNLAGIYSTGNKYLVQVHHNGKNKHVGYCSSIEEARVKRDLAMSELKLKNKYHHAPI